MQPISRILILLSSLIMVALFFVPIWQIQMWAPQYPEWLSMHIWIDNITGDIAIINGLNHYIGMKEIHVEMFPEFEIMPYILGGIIALGIILALIGKQFGVWTYLVVLVLAGIAGMLDFYLWSYDYGHNLDPTAAIKVPGMSYQPPLIGSKELLNFLAFSAPDIGGWLAVAAGVLGIAAAVIEVRKRIQYKTAKRNPLVIK
ncbi:membrane protein [Anditalea andensis]|uniref:Membrane protein n=2 Tax=Anditalea andensis TaxID=1048983 RepID=A0A074L3Q7_9BACT|nr:membrane protein [Anditalea andensis]